MTNKLSLFTLLILLLAAACGSKNEESATTNRKKAANETEENIYRAADSMMAAFKRHDWKTFASYNHPSMLQMMGGPGHFVSFIKEQMKNIPDTAIKSMNAGDILQVVKTNDDMQCVLEQQMHMRMEGIDINTTTYLVGQSLDDGKTWTFFDAATNGLVTPKDIKPNLSPELKIPAQKKEVEQLK